MRAKTRVLAGLATVGVVVAMALPAGAATPPINGTGTTKCNITGTIKFKPALMNGGTSPSTVTIKAKGTSCTGTGDGANVVSVGLKGSMTTATNDCSSLAGTMNNTLAATAKWKQAKGTAKLNPSTVTFTSETGNAGAQISFDASGSVTAGSFNGDSASAHAVLQESIATVATACGSKGGVKTLHIVAPSTSTLG